MFQREPHREPQPRRYDEEFAKEDLALQALDAEPVESVDWVKRTKDRINKLSNEEMAGEISNLMEQINEYYVNASDPTAWNEALVKLQELVLDKLDEGDDEAAELHWPDVERDLRMLMKKAIH